MRMKLAACFLLALLFAMPSVQAQVDGITLDNVVGLYQGNNAEVECGVPVKFNLRITNITGGVANFTATGIANGFEIYSPNGATWTPDFSVDTTIVLFPPPASTTLDTILYGRFINPTEGGAGLVWNGADPQIFDGGLFINFFSDHDSNQGTPPLFGSGYDTVGFAGFNQTTGVGIYQTFDEVSLQIAIASINCASNNLTICLDSAYFRPAGNWLWSGDAIQDQTKPNWDGPHCWTIKDPSGATYSNPLSGGVLNFNTGTNGLDRDTTFQVSSTPTGAPVGYSLAVGTWLSVTTSSGTTPSNFTLTFDPDSQPLQVLTDTLYITDGTKSPNAVVSTVVVNFDVASDVKESGGNLPTAYALNQNYPNPFNPTTTIKFALPEATNVSLDIYNVLGQKVRTLVSEPLAANNYEIEWDGQNDAGSNVASGIYFYKLQTDTFVNTKKMILSR